MVRDMAASPVIRPMREEDVPAVHELAVLAFEDLARRSGEPPEPRPEPAQAHVRLRHLVRTDAGGAWVAEAGGAVVGSALALVREGVWGLSLLVVAPALQSAGLGGRLLRRAHAHANRARGRIVLSSDDPRALRAYARLGLQVHPALYATGVPAGVSPPAGVREGGRADIPLTAGVDRYVRGAAHGGDIDALLAAGATLLVLPERGYAVIRRASPGLLAAVDEPAARDLLRAVLARADGETVTVDWLTAGQDWAVEVCLDAGLELRAGRGALFLGGDVGPFRPYLPSGAYL